MIEGISHWLTEHPLPSERPSEGWGDWVVSLPTGEVFAGMTPELAEVLLQLDGITDAPDEFGRYLNQVRPLGTDLAASKSEGVRFMTMAASKGLTVKAVIVAAVEDGIMPRPEADLAEERRLLYVAMTRAREHLFCTWARRRVGPTARSGTPNVGAYRHHSGFLRDGPVTSQSGTRYLRD
jgi:superfamily I DNA/RNA helicase